MATNVAGAFLHSREAVKAMLPNRSGAIDVIFNNAG